MTGSYCYEYPRPALTADIVIFTYLDKKLQVLLIERGEEPFKNCLALPGGFVREGETVLECAKRELFEETGLTIDLRDELGCFSAPDRDPRGWVVTVAFLALVPASPQQVRAGSDAAKAYWSPVIDLIETADDDPRQSSEKNDLFGGKLPVNRRRPNLAFDHAEILRAAFTRLGSFVSYGNKLEERMAQARLLLDLLPTQFTMPDAADLMSALSTSPVQRANFRKWFLEFVEQVPDEEVTDPNGLQFFRAKEFENEADREQVFMNQVRVRKMFRDLNIFGLPRVLGPLAQLTDGQLAEIDTLLKRYADPDVYEIRANPTPAIQVNALNPKAVLLRITFHRKKGQSSYVVERVEG